MNRSITAVLVVLAASLSCFAMPARAEMAAGEHKSGSIGFHSTEAPLGIRWWLGGQKVGIDAGLGFGSTPAGVADEKLKNWTIEVGVPMVMHSWNHFHMLFRPGIVYHSEEVVIDESPFDTDNATRFDVNAEIEGEAFLMDNFSVSASTGLRFRSLNPVGPGDNLTSFETIGNNFTNVGFHIYFFGGGE